MFFKSIFNDLLNLLSFDNIRSQLIKDEIVGFFSFILWIIIVEQLFMICMIRL